jgi:hypothetical protein
LNLRDLRNSPRLAGAPLNTIAALLPVETA